MKRKPLVARQDANAVLLGLVSLALANLACSGGAARGASASGSGAGIGDTEGDASSDDSGVLDGTTGSKASSGGSGSSSGGSSGVSSGASSGGSGSSSGGSSGVSSGASSGGSSGVSSGDGGAALPLDKVIFGDSVSEASHSLSASFSAPTDTTQIYWMAATPSPSEPSATAPSDVVGGGMGLSARRLLPRTPNGDVYGGQVMFTMAVDPVKQNYFTVKMWGSDAGGGFLILDVNGKEIGDRHAGGGLTEDPLYFTGTGWYAGRFIYRTEPLPLPMTRGKTSATLTIRSLGSMFDYAPIFTYVPQYQHIMSGPSPGVYVGYTHTGALVDVSGEVQGTPPTAITPRTSENETTALGDLKSRVNAALAGKLVAAADSLSPADIQLLARCYDAKELQGQTWITYPASKTAADLVRLVVAAIDAQVTAQSATAGYVSAHGNDGWGGYFGPMGDAIRVLWSPIRSGTTMTTAVPYAGSYGTVTRQVGWGKALRASVDAGRFGRQNIGNQAMYNATNIYYANRGLQLVDGTKALNESEALRYPKEAWGVVPWMGNDQQSGGTDGAGGGPIPTEGTAPYGPNWYMCTSKGTTKDGNGFVGSDYGEVAAYGFHLALDAGDPALAQRALVMARARGHFRYPGVDDKGYLVMMGTDPIGVRNNDLPSHYAYLGRFAPDDFLMASQGASVVGSDLLGYFQQGVNDGQAFRNFSSTDDLGSTTEYDPYVPGRWAAIKAMAQTNVKLPATPGQPDFAWVDEENMVVAAKHGEERFYANLFWRQPGFINGLAKVFLLTPTTARLADAMVDDVRFRTTGASVTTGKNVDAFVDPPDHPTAAYGAMNFLTAWRSDLAVVPPTNRDAGRATGYTFRYGSWLVGINADYGADYTVQTPARFTAATDLISGFIVMGPVVLKPKTSVVFYVPMSLEDSAPPSRTLYLGAVGASRSVTLAWNDAGGATSYDVLRSTVSGKSYTPLLTGIKTNTAIDTTVTSGATYYYVVTSNNATGVSGYSPEASASPK